jgi:hypothetical protein
VPIPPNLERLIPQIRARISRVSVTAH